MTVRNFLLFIVFVFGLYKNHYGQPMTTKDSLGIVFSTYVGGKTFEQIRDIVTDRKGNVYITGGTQSRDFPTTEGAYDRTFAEGGTSLGSGVPMDVFVVKYSPEGNMSWSTLLGGPNYDRAYAIEVDDSGYVYVAGRAGDGFPTTGGVLQPQFGDDSSPNGLYGKQDGFVAKLSRDGSQLLWSTYFGRSDGGIIRDIAIDDSGYVYIAHPGVMGQFPHITPNAFQGTYGGGADVVVAKLDRDGSRVLWATYYGGSGNDGGGPSIRLDPQRNVYVLGATNSTDLPKTQDAFDTSFNGGASDNFVAKLSPNGSTLLYATYLGGSANEGVETHNLAVDPFGNAYVSAGTNSIDYPTTPGVLFRQYQGGNGDTFISKLSSDGKHLLASTYIGGNAGDFSQGIYVDREQNVFIGGGTRSSNFPITTNAFQRSHAGTSASDFFLLKINSELNRVLYASYIGGSSTDDGRTLWADEKGNVYIAG